MKEISTEETDGDWFLIPKKKTNWKGAIYLQFEGRIRAALDFYD